MRILTVSALVLLWTACAAQKHHYPDPTGGGGGPALKSDVLNDTHWTAFSLPRIDGQATYDFAIDTIEHRISVRGKEDWLGSLSLSGEYVATDTDGVLKLEARYASAILKTQSGTVVDVTEGACGDCDGFIFGEGNPMPESCMCKTQTLDLQLDRTTFTTVLDGQPISFYMER